MTKETTGKGGQRVGGRSSSITLLPEDKAKAERVIRTLRIFMEEMPGAVITDLALLLAIAAHERGQGEHAAALGLDKSGVSVAVRRLGDGRGRGGYREGLRWVELKADPMDDRRKIPVLTPAGAAMASLLLQSMGTKG